MTPKLRMHVSVDLFWTPLFLVFSVEQRLNERHVGEDQRSVFCVDDCDRYCERPGSSTFSRLMSEVFVLCRIDPAFVSRRSFPLPMQSGLALNQHLLVTTRNPPL